MDVKYWALEKMTTLRKYTFNFRKEILNVRATTPIV
jgi:hypothetical protein